VDDPWTTWDRDRALGFGINGFFFFIFFLIWEGLGFTCPLTLKPEATDLMLLDADRCYQQISHEYTV